MELQFFSVDGKLYPEPISWALPEERVLEIEEEVESGKRKRAVTIETKRLSFQLFKSTKKEEDDECFILQMHEIQEDVFINYQLSIDQKERKNEVKKAKRTRVGESEMVIMTKEHSSLLVDTSHSLLLQEQLVGWTRDVRKRDGPNNITDKYYIHEKVGKKFRSLPEVGTFILFNAIPNDSRKGKKKKEKNNLENIDEEAVPFGEDNARQVVSSNPTRQEACMWLGTFDMAEEVAMTYGQAAFSLSSSSPTSGPSTARPEKNELEYLDDSVLEELLESSEEQQKK